MPVAGSDAGGPGGEVSGVRAPAGLYELRRRVDDALAGLVEDAVSEVGSGAGDAVRHAVLSPGKRIRPLLLLAAYRAVAGRIRTGTVTLACSVELVHAYSLVHDDLPCMDDDVLRRGRPTLHVRFGAPVAVFAGAALMPLAVRAVCRAGRQLGLPEGRARGLVRILAAASGGVGMVGGQLLDLEAEGRSVSRDELERIHAGKTAALVEASVRMGAVAAGAAEGTVERLGRFGFKLGLAFQAVDDILDVTGEAGELGKAGGRDQALQKATYPSVMGLEAAERVSRRLAAEARSELEGLDEVDELAALARYVVRRSR